MWTKIENPDTKQIGVVDLGEIDGANLDADGVLHIWMKSGRYIQMDPKGSAWTKGVWAAIMKGTDLPKESSL